MDAIGEKKLIACILPKGGGRAIVESLYREKGVVTANVASGRGVGMVDRFFPGAGVEVELVTAVVDEEMAEHIFAFIHDAAGIGEKPGAFMYQHRLTGATAYKLPDVPEEHEEGALKAIDAIASKLHLKEEPKKQD